MLEGHVNEILTAPFQHYRMFGSVAGFVSPRIDVPSSQIRTRSQDALLQTTHTGVVTNHRDPAGRVTVKYNDNPVTLIPRRLRADIPDAERADAQNMIGDIDMDHTEAIAYGLGLDWEIEVRDKAMAPASFPDGNKIRLDGTTNKKLTDSSADFRVLVEEGVNAVAENGGTMPDSIIIPPKVMPKLLGNDKIVDVIKRRGLGGLSKRVLAEYLSGEGAMWSEDDIMIPRCRHNAGDEINRKFEFVWNLNHILIFKRAMPNVAIQDPFFMATYTFEGTPIVASRRGVDFAGDIVEGLYWHLAEVEGYERAYLIQDAI